ncbi:hypothetical protein [Paenibacillus sp. OSY-SE]|nr:hypothetical protein [Paenibacillus sp. OSY-SE]
MSNQRVLAVVSGLLFLLGMRGLFYGSGPFVLASVITIGIGGGFFSARR